MKIDYLILLLSCFLFLGTLQAQQYSLIDVNEEQHFLSPQISAAGLLEQEIFSIRIDSVRTVGSDVIYLNYKNCQVLDYAFHSCYAFYTDSSWLGHQIMVKPTGQYIFLNAQLDSIYIASQANLNDSWNLFDLGNGSYLEATISQHDTQTVIGVLDSIKTMLIQAKDASGAAIAHPMNGKTFSWGKQLGWVRVYNMFEFPLNTTHTYTLIGSTAFPATVPQPTAQAIFDYAIGDEFHTLERTSNFLIAYLSGSTKFLQRTILAKSISNNQDTLRYTVEVCGSLTSYNFQNSTIINDTIIISDTIQETIILSEYSDLSGLGREPAMIDGRIGYLSYYQGTNFESMQFAERNSVAHYEVGMYDSLHQCYTYWAGPSFRAQYYIDGLGGPYFTYNQAYSSERKELTYYKKGNETWGTDQNCTHYVSVEEPNKTLTQVQLFPNPAHTTVNLVIKGFEIGAQWQLQVVNALGQQVIFTSIEQAQTQISVQALPVGLYYYQLVAPNTGQQYTGQLQVH